MAKRDEVAISFLVGKDPEQIARYQKRETKKVKNDLLSLVGEGKIKYSDILYRIPEKTRMQFEEVHERALQGMNADQSLRSKGLDIEIYDLYLTCLKYCKADAFVMISTMELELHKIIKFVLQSLFGEQESEWWGIGVPEKIRQECVRNREAERGFKSEPYQYSTLIHLMEIAEANWKHLSKLLPTKFGSDKNHFKEAFRNLNRLRNCVMHPVKDIRLTEEDFKFLRETSRLLSPDNWQWKNLPGFKVG